MDTENKQGIGKSVIDWLESLVFAIAVIVCVFTLFFRNIEVVGDSMVPNYQNGDRVAIFNITGELNQGDVIIVEGVIDEPIIKRIIATEGQIVDFDTENYTVSVDGETFDDAKYNIATNITQKTLVAESLDYPLTIPKGCVFVLGDNRPRSKDSRHPEVGVIDERRIIGKVWFKIFPFTILN